MDDAERLEALEDCLARLSEMAEDGVLLVEGTKDVAALRSVGVDGEFFCVQSGGGPLRAAEHVWERGRRAIVLTDWDRRGGNLADSLRRDLESLCVPYDDTIRRELAVLCRPYSKDVESVDTVLVLLRGRVSGTATGDGGPTEVHRDGPGPPRVHPGLPEKVGGPHRRPPAHSSVVISAII